jgi:hypothetical protein
MAMKPITLQLPEKIYELYRQKAEQAQRSVEDEVLEVVSASAPPDGMSPELAQEIEALKSLSDKLLWKVAAQSHLTVRESQKLARLNAKQQREGSSSLLPEEAQIQKELLYQYERRMLIRAQAILLLQQRGHDISKLLKVS